LLEATPADIDQHIQYAKLGGFRLLDLYYLAFAKSCGHFPWRPEYPGEMADLQGVVKKISDAGIVPGIHIHYDKAHKKRSLRDAGAGRATKSAGTLHLAESIDAEAAVITIEENPRLCTMDNERRILKVLNELITYDRFTTSPPYQFEGCRRGALGTHASPHERAP